MANILTRIQEIAQQEGITIGAMERKIGASKGVLSRAINNGTDIQSKWIQIIVENYPHYSAAWLLTGQGEMFTNSTPNATAAPATTSDAMVDRLLNIISEKDTIIREQAEVIGQLRERLTRQGGNADDAYTETVANVG